MAHFDPYESYKISFKNGSPKTTSGYPGVNDEDVIILPELPKQGTAPGAGAHTHAGHGKASGAAKARPPSLNFGPRQSSARGSPPTSLTPSYRIGAHDYSLPPTADASRRLLDDEYYDPGPKPELEWSASGTPSPLQPVRRVSSLPSASRNREEGWWSRHFEPPEWRPLAVHTALCLIAYPVVSLLLPLARGSIFWVRAYVSLGCSVVGLSIGFSLLALVRKWIEAAGKRPTLSHHHTSTHFGICSVSDRRRPVLPTLRSVGNCHPPKRVRNGNGNPSQGHGDPYIRQCELVGGSEAPD
jgi:hypothetical protein